MNYEDFVAALYAAGWQAPNDAQHTNVRALWRKLFPLYWQIEQLEQELEMEQITNTTLVENQGRL